MSIASVTAPFSRAFFAGVLLLASIVVPLSAADEKVVFNLPGGDAATELKSFAAQAGTQVAFSGDAVNGMKTNAVRGSFTPREALEQMLHGTGLHVTESRRTGAFAVTRTLPNAERAAPRSDRPQSQDSEFAEKKVVLDTFEVFGSKTLNMDLPRSRDDALPYVVFDRQSITNSGATTLEEFFRNRLSMESTSLSESQTTSNLGGRSTINLRGLGANQTLILVDGHRMSGVVSVGSPSQPDLNGIPLSAVERIEVLPTSASAIYGGSATGGVVNIVLRRDYSGVELQVTYGNAFDTDVATRQVDFSAGMSLLGGRTNVLIAASASDSNRLLAQDRGLRERGLARIMANNPALINAQAVPPIGSTSNIRSTTGQDLVLDNNTPLGSPFTYVPIGYAGPASDNGMAFVANAGRYNLENAQTVTSGQRALISAPERESLMLTVRHEFSKNFQAFLELSGSNSTSRYPSANTATFVLPAANPNNPFQQQIRITTPFYGVNDLAGFTSSKDRRAVGGVIAQLPGDWKGEVDYSWHQATLLNLRTVMSSAGQAAATAAVTGGTINLLRDTMLHPVTFLPYFDQVDGGLPSRSINRTVTGRASGPVGQLPAGRPMLSALVEQRDQEYGGPGSGTTQPQTQRVQSVYMETTLPLVSPDMQFPFAREVELHVAARWDDYSTKGMSFATPFAPAATGNNRFESVNPSVGVRWLVNPGVMLRASYGTGFLPPDVNQVAPIVFPSMGFYQDPRRGNEQLGFFDEIFGGNANLRPEESETWSAGLVLTPEGVSGLRLSVDWNRIEKTDNFASPSAFDLLANENQFPGRIVRGPVPPGDPYGVGPIIAVDTSLINMSRAAVETVDGAFDYSRDFPFGRIDFFATATYAVSFETQLLPTSPVVEQVGRANSVQSAAGGRARPLRWRGSMGLTWTRGPMQAGWSMRYIDDYLLDTTSAATLLGQGNAGRIDSQVYHDVFASYSFPAQPGNGRWQGLWSNTQVRVGVKNLFNTEPPFDASNTANYYSGFGDPRLASYYVSVKRRF
jgi:iron complex outermembrane recepter protein